MRRFGIMIFVIIKCSFSYSQNYFSKVFDFGGDEMEGKIYNIIPVENGIKIIGLLHDSIVPGFDGGTWPILGSLSYDGEYLGTKYLIDSLYSKGFTYFKRRIAFKNDSICYLYDRRDLGAKFLDAYLIEINYLSGQVIRSTVIHDEISTHETFLATDIAVNENGDIYLINITDVYGPHPQILTVLDSNFTVKSQAFIPSMGRSNTTKFTEVDAEGNIIIIGVSLGMYNGIWFESKLFRQVLDSSYNSIEFKLAETSYDQTIAEYGYYPIIKAKSGDWVFATQVAIPTNDCQGCSIWIPYVVCISSDFSEVRWEKRLFDGDSNSSRPAYYVQTITEVNDGYIFAGSTDGDVGNETSGLLGKVTLSGDSLWLKHIIPIEWDTVQGLWFQLQDIKTTPNGNIIVGGFGSDRYISSIVPWILHLDSDGCVVPGCNIVSTVDKHYSEESELFTVYPNPATSFICINTSSELSENCILSIYDSSGKVITKKKLNPQQNYQYLISLPDQIQGHFILSIENVFGKVIYSKSILIN